MSSDMVPRREVDSRKSKVESHAGCHLSANSPTESIPILAPGQVRTGRVAHTFRIMECMRVQGLESTGSLLLITLLALREVGSTPTPQETRSHRAGRHPRLTTGQARPRFQAWKQA
jgi:hypothetical protein